MGFESSPEPEPEFHMAQMVWGKAWPLHVYLFATLFMILSIYNVNSIAGLLTKAKQIKKKTIFMFTNFMLWSFNLVTSLQLFIDPYGSNKAMKLKGLDFLLFGMKLPCLTCAFSFIYIALTETTKVKLYSRKLHNIKYFIAIIIGHFVVSLAVHLYLIFTQKHFQLVIICLGFFLLFSLAISAIFLFNFCKIKNLLGNSPHVPSMRFHSKPEHKHEARLTLSTHVDEHDGGSYKSYQVHKTAVSRGIVNEGLDQDSVKGAVRLSNGHNMHNVTNNTNSSLVIANGNVSHDVSHSDVQCTTTSNDRGPSLGIVNYGIDMEDGSGRESSDKIDVSETTFNETTDSGCVLEDDDKYMHDDQVSNDGDVGDDNNNDNNVDCDSPTVPDGNKTLNQDTICSEGNGITPDIKETDEMVPVCDEQIHQDSPGENDPTDSTTNKPCVVQDINDIKITFSNEDLPEPTHADLTPTEKVPTLLTVPDTSRDIAIEVIPDGEGVTQTNDITNEVIPNEEEVKQTNDITIEVIPNDETVKHTEDIIRDGISCNGYINETYATTDSISTTEVSSPVISTNVIASLKGTPSIEENINKEPFENVLSNYALPNGGETQRSNLDGTLNRKRPAFVDKSLSKLFKLVVVVSLSSSLYCAAIIYYIIIVVSDYENLQKDPWPWFAYQTVARFAELGMSATMSYLVRRSYISLCKGKKK